MLKQNPWSADHLRREYKESNSRQITRILHYLESLIKNKEKWNCGNTAQILIYCKTGKARYKNNKEHHTFYPVVWNE
jgi:hypothetical protein